jgi:hypothetical protein
MDRIGWFGQFFKQCEPAEKFLIEDHDDPSFFLWSEADQFLFSNDEFVYDPDNAGHMTAAFETEPLLVRRADLPSKNGGVSEHGNVNAL